MTEGLFAKAEVKKGSIISTLNFPSSRMKPVPERGKELPAEESETNSMLMLMIKRSASKVEKLKPGLTHTVWQGAHLDLRGDHRAVRGEAQVQATWVRRVAWNRGQGMSRSAIRG